MRCSLFNCPAGYRVLLSYFDPWSHLTLKDQGRSDFGVISGKGAQLGHIFAIKNNRKPYVGCSIAPLDLKLGDLERSQSNLRSLTYSVV